MLRLINEKKYSLSQCLTFLKSLLWRYYFWSWVVTTRESYAYNFLLKLEVSNLYIFTMFLAIYLTIEIFLMVEVMCATVINLTILYICVCSSKFWLSRIWYGRVVYISVHSHLNSLKVTHNFLNDILFSLDWSTFDVLRPKSRVKNCIQYYRGIYLMNEDMNLAFGKLFIPLSKLLLLAAVIISVFALIRLRANLDALSFALLGVVLIGCSILVVPISIIISQTYQISKYFKPNISTIINQIEDKRKKEVLRGQLKSCALIRCKVGNLYQMEAKAKLTMLDRTVNGIVCLLVNVKC